MSVENIVNEAVSSEETGQKTMTVLRRVFRSVTLGLQIIAMLCYYVPALLSGGSTGVIWLIIGVVQTGVFCAIFFRDSRTRTGISVALMIVATIWNIFIFFITAFYVLLGSEMGLDFSYAVTYSICSLISVIFALCFPRKYITG